MTGSHNPPEYNGLKMMIGGITLFADQIQGILARIRNEDWRTAEVPGTIRREDVVPAYLERVLSDVRLERSMRIAIDAGNGVAGPVAARLFKSLGCEVTELFTDVDGTFPNHHPDPSKPANLEDLKKAVLEDGIELGLAFDGDGDRLGVVTIKCRNGRRIKYTKNKPRMAPMVSKCMNSACELLSLIHI